MTMTMVAAILALIGSPDPETLPARLQDEEAPQRPRELRPVERAEEFDPPQGFTIDLVFQFKSIGGSTKVREFDFHPTRLRLSNDLGMDNAGGGRLAFRWDTQNFGYFLETELFAASGKGEFRDDFAYDEGHFKGNIPYETSWTAFFARAGVVFRNVLPDPVAGGWIAPMVGLEYPRMSLSINQPLANEESGEQYEQFIPYPILGIAMSIPIDPSFTISGRAYGSYVPRMPTPFTEGGRMYMEIATINAEANITWRLTGALRLTAGVGYQFWHGTLSSGEDGNDLNFNAPYVQIGLELRW